MKPQSRSDAATSKPVGAAEPRAADAIRTLRTVMSAVAGFENVLMEPSVMGRAGIRGVKAHMHEVAEQLRGLIESGEQVELLIAATLARPGRKGSGMLCITDRRLSFLEHGKEPQAWDLDAITSPTMQTSGLRRKPEPSFQVEGEPFTLSKLTPAAEADRVLSLLQRASGASSPPPPGVDGKARVTVQWIGEEAPDAARVQIEGDFLGYAAAILDGELPRALQRIAKPDGGSWTVDVEGGRELPNQSHGAEPGRITITAQRLSETFDARELRRCVEGCVNAAVEEGERRAAEDETRARRFLDELAGTSPRS